LRSKDKADACLIISSKTNITLIKGNLSISIEENKAIVRHLFDELFNKGNPSAANDVITPDYVDHSPIPASLPGPEDLGQRTVMLRAAFVSECVFGEFLAEGDLVAFTWTLSGIHNGPLVGMAATGKYLVLAGINVERMKEGKIVEHWSQFDLAGAMRQIQSAAK
jgi:predicted SnoaL-like aldol condensation-catalyzing enzyme